MYLYREAETFFHELHPVTKVLLLLGMIVIPFLRLEPEFMFIVLVAYTLVLLWAKGGTNLGKFWKLLILFWVFTCLIWVVVPTLRGWPWSFSNAAALATRVDSFVLAGLLFVTITRLEEFTYALTRLGVPYRAAFTLSLGFRLVPLFYQNLQIIVAAQRSRGVDLDSGSLLKRGRKYGTIIGVLLSYSIRNADLMAMSLEAKGFGYTSERTSYLQPTFRASDAMLLFVLITGSLMLLWLPV